MAAVSRKLVFRKIASREFDAAADSYERERAEFGASFLQEIEALLDLVAEYPAAYPVVLGEVRRAVCRRFPYCIYFKERADQIVVLGVFHAARNREVWRRRL